MFQISRDALGVSSVPQLGQSYNSVDDKLVGAGSVVNFSKELVETKITQVSMDTKIITSTKEMLDSLDVSGSLQLKLAILPISGSIKGSYTKKFEESKNSIFILIKYVITTRTIQMDTRGENKPSFQSNLAKIDPNKFFEGYGDSFVFGMTYGAELYGLCQIDTNSLEQKEDIAGSLKAEINFGVGSLELTGSLDKKVNDITKNASKSFTIKANGGKLPESQPQSLENMISIANDFLKSVPENDVPISCTIAKYPSLLNYPIGLDTKLNTTVLRDFYSNSLASEFLDWKALDQLLPSIKNSLSDYSFNGKQITIEDVALIKDQIGKSISALNGLINDISSAKEIELKLPSPTYDEWSAKNKIQYAYVDLKKTKIRNESGKLECDSSSPNYIARFFVDCVKLNDSLLNPEQKEVIKNKLVVEVFDNLDSKLENDDYTLDLKESLKGFSVSIFLKKNVNCTATLYFRNKTIQSNELILLGSTEFGKSDTKNKFVPKEEKPISPVETSQFRSGFESSDFDEKHPFRNQQGERRFTKAIKFSKPFTKGPVKVVTSLQKMDLVYSVNTRLEVIVKDVDLNGFTLEFFTWGDTVVYRAGASWIAYNEVENSDQTPQTKAVSTFRSGFESDDFDEKHPFRSQKGERRFTKAIKFAKPFTKGPVKVVTSLQKMDLLNSVNTRLEVTVKDVDLNGFNLEFFTWSDSVVYRAGASWIAYNETNN